MSTSLKKKFIWDEKMTCIYIKICVQEVMLGNKPTTHLNKKGWLNLQENFNLLSKRNLDSKQLKNKWNNLKKDWQIWKGLLGKETDIGLNIVNKTIEGSNDWWEAKLKEMPVAVKFREKGLLMPDEMGLIFGDVVATGQQTCTSSLGAFPGTQMVDAALEGSGDNDDSPHEGAVAEEHVDVLASKDKGKGKRMHSCGSTNKTKKKQCPVQSIQVSLEQLPGVVESVQKVTDTCIEGCVEVLNSLNIKNDPDYFYECLYLLTMEKDFRKFLLCLKEPETQLGFLKKMVMERKR